MDNINNTIKMMIEKRIGSVHTALPAQIREFDHKKMRAKIVLLNRKELNGESVEIPPIIEVPIMHVKFGSIIIRPGYQKEDVVQVIFNEKALDKLLISGKPEDVKFTRKFSYDDAVVVGGLMIESESDYPNEEAESLYICNIEQNTKFVLKQDGTIIIADDKNGTEIRFNISNGNLIQTLSNNLLIGDDTASDNAVLLSKLLTLVSELQSHTHPGDSGGTTGTPDQTFTTNLGSSEVFFRK